MQAASAMARHNHTENIAMACNNKKWQIRCVIGRSYKDTLPLEQINTNYGKQLTEAAANELAHCVQLQRMQCMI